MTHVTALGKTIQTVRGRRTGGVRTPIDVERLLWWAYVRQCVLAGGGTGLADRRHGEGDGPLCSTQGRAVSHADAYIVSFAVNRLPSDQRGLVITHAKSESRPDWKPDMPDLERVGAHAFIDWTDLAAFHRDIYADWWDGLAAVAERLRAQASALQLWAVTGPAAPSRPWFAPRVRPRVLTARAAPA